MLTVPEAAKKTGKNPETIRRWIRAGLLPSQRVGTQHLIAEADLRRVTEKSSPPPRRWRQTKTGEPMPDWVALVREGRDAR